MIPFDPILQYLINCTEKEQIRKAKLKTKMEGLKRATR